MEPTPEVAPVISSVIDEPEGEEGGEAREEEEGKRRKKKGEKVSHDSESKFFIDKTVRYGELSKFNSSDTENYQKLIVLC